MMTRERGMEIEGRRRRRRRRRDLDQTQGTREKGIEYAIASLSLSLLRGSQVEETMKKRKGDCVGEREREKDMATASRQRSIAT